MISALGKFARSTAGYVFLLLAAGTAIAATVSLLISEQIRRQDFARLRLERVMASVTDVDARLNAAPAETMRLLGRGQIIGARLARADASPVPRDKELERLLRVRFGGNAAPVAGRTGGATCFPARAGDVRRAAGLATAPPPACWLVQFTGSGGHRRSLAIDVPRLQVPPSSTLSPVYLLSILLVSGLLAVLAARMASAPLRRLERSARAFSISLDVAPVPERGPTEVRAALATFNLMQARVREGYLARTRLLAGISHDLKTPLTRLRLRLEQVGDPELRARLIDDLAAMRALVDEGLELAGSSERTEAWSTVDLDSLLASLAEDAAEFGSAVTFAGGCGLAVPTRVQALTRCLTNLIDNAVAYGGDAELSCVADGERVLIRVRDHGPGIAPELLPRIFEPFTRGDAGQPGGRHGSGIGLTIAHTLALTFGGRVDLANHPDGGVLATVELPVGEAQLR